MQGVPPRRVHERERAVPEHPRVKPHQQVSRVRGAPGVGEPPRTAGVPAVRHRGPAGDQVVRDLPPASRHRHRVLRYPQLPHCSRRPQIVFLQPGRGDRDRCRHPVLRAFRRFASFTTFANGKPPFDATSCTGRSVTDAASILISASSESSDPHDPPELPPTMPPFAYPPRPLLIESSSGRYLWACDARMMYSPFDTIVGIESDVPDPGPTTGPPCQSPRADFRRVCPTTSGRITFCT